MKEIVIDISDDGEVRFETAGFKAQTLAGGYKTYRRYILSYFAKPAKIAILGGLTGSGKTEVLKEIAQLGEQVIDLEGIAHHKGSSFGAIGELPQPTNQQFENELFEQWQHIDPQKTVWLEDESQAVGSVWLPEPFFRQMRSADVFVIEIAKEERIKRLVANYAENPDLPKLEAALLRIKKRLGGQHFKTALEALYTGDFAKVADISLDYYDKAYNHGLSKRSPETVHRFKPSTSEPAVVARELLYCKR